jgi:periplasmic divalent cation tolerance protein
MQTVFVYMTTGSIEEAQAIGSSLVKERLAACVNIIDQMTSIFDWEGKIDSAKETILIAKTTAERFDDLEKRVIELHSYDLPCIVALPVEKGHEPFLSWIDTSVKG